MYDAIVIGGGHNGLTCGSYLAKAGKRTLVLEANSYLGGYCTTRELVPEAPGWRFNPCAVEFISTCIPRSVVDDLQLERHGLSWLFPDPYITSMQPDGACFSIWHDLDRTVKDISRYSRRDGELYGRVMRELGDLFYTAVPYLQDHPKRPSARTVAEVLTRAARNRRSVAAGHHFLKQPATSFLEQFERDEVKNFLAVYMAGGMGPLEEVGSCGIMMWIAMQHRWPMRFPVGGSGAFIDALVACFQSDGGEIRTDAPVARVLVNNGHATGVALASGEEIRAKDVIAAIDPMTVFTRLVEESEVPTEVMQELKGLQVLHFNLSSLVGNIALSRRPKWSVDLAQSRGGAYILGPDWQATQKLVHQAVQGHMTDDIPLYIGMQSNFDRSLVPPGSEGESLLVYSLAAPYELADGKQWADEKAAYMDRCLDVVAEYAPDLKDSVIGVDVKSPQDFNNEWVYKGALYHVDPIPSQMGASRPTPSLAGYKTPITGLWHSGSGAHPLGTVCGWPGRSTARTLLKAERKGRFGVNGGGGHAASRRTQGMSRNDPANGNGASHTPGRAPVMSGRD